MSTTSVPNKNKICVLGNSVAMLVVPDRKNTSEKTYFELLEENGYRTINASKQAVILSDVFKYLEDEVIRKFPDFVIINFGIVEATYRTKNRCLHNYFSGNAWNNNIINTGYCSFSARVFRKAIKILYKPFSRILFSLHIKWRFMSPSRYKHALTIILTKLLAYTPVKRIIILGMLPVNDKLEKVTSGTSKSVVEYNELMKDICDIHDKVSYLDMNKLFKTSDDIGLATMDSIHLTAYGHKKVFDKINQIIAGEER